MFVENKKANKTELEIQAEMVDSESELSTTADKLQEVGNRILEIFASFLGVEKGGELIINKDYLQTTISQLQYQMLSDLSDKGYLSPESFLQELKRLGALDSVDIDRELKLMEATMIQGGENDDTSK
jgi:hypothetical protein